MSGAAPTRCTCTNRRRICGCSRMGPCLGACRREPRGCACHGLCDMLGREPTDGDILDAMLGSLVDQVVGGARV